MVGHFLDVWVEREKWVHSHVTWKVLILNLNIRLSMLFLNIAVLVLTGMSVFYCVLQI